MPTDMTIQATLSPASARAAPNVVKTLGAKDVAAPEQTRPEPQTKPEASAEALQKAVEKFASQVQSFQRNLNFSIDDSTGRTVVKVIDMSNDEVIRQIPSEEMLALAQHLSEIHSEGEQAISGLLMQSTA